MKALTNRFQDFETDFYHYMIDNGGLSKKAGRDYISRLRFIANDYSIDENITEDYINFIIDSEKIKCQNRDKYNTKKAMVDFHSGLMKFLKFINSDYSKIIQDSETNQISDIKESKYIKDTEKTALIQSRIGQGLFRTELINYWKGCSISGCTMSPLLIASHIKPWKNSSNIERLDVFNGLLLLPNYDKLFDKGYISFDNHGKIIISSLLDKVDRYLLGITSSTHLIRLEQKHLEYLKYHQENCFL